jgi:hypothetical protein
VTNGTSEMTVSGPGWSGTSPPRPADSQLRSTMRSESRCALGLRYGDLVVSIEGAVDVCLMS